MYSIVVSLLTMLLSAMLLWWPHFGSLLLVSYYLSSLFSSAPPEVSVFCLLVFKLGEFLFPLYEEHSLPARTFLFRIGSETATSVLV